MSRFLTPKLLSMGDSLYFHCPGCNLLHPYRVRGESPGPRWTYNDKPECPTFLPSLLVNKSHPGTRCHLFLQEGRIRYLDDCWHSLAGQTIDMVDIPDPEFWID